MCKGAIPAYAARNDRQLILLLVLRCTFRRVFVLCAGTDRTAGAALLQLSRLLDGHSTSTPLQIYVVAVAMATRSPGDEANIKMRHRES
ncbi:hypothetical protein J6590_084355 [Homalodisca vitripennis]|nr:hypothetical protein J6590_084355 [Homalodisca vitripennis]